MHSIARWTAALMMWSVILGASAHAQDWYTYRHDSSRTGSQPVASALSDTTLVSTLHCAWSFPPDEHCGSLVTKPSIGQFLASPIVVNDTVFIGNLNGYFYALDAASGTLKWQYPLASEPSLRGSCAHYGQYGIRSSATYAKIGDQDVVIFGAPDPSAAGGLGSAALFAISAFGSNAGHLIWKSQPVARVNGCTSATGGQDPAADQKSLTEHHGRIANSAPLVLGNKVYIGIHDDTDDDPIQQGRVSAVDLSSGNVVPFSYVSTGTLDNATRGGGVWNSPATDEMGIYFTTGNTRFDSAGRQSLEPHPNHGLSLIRADKDTGNVIWTFQPVPYNLDDDPDWAAGATVMSTSCGGLIASVQKDGWTYAVNAGTGSCSWQFPPVTPPIADPTSPHCAVTGYSKFNPNGPHIHGSNKYLQPGAAWNDVLIIHTGGESLVSDGATAGYGKLHALNACATTEQDRVRWIADIPNTGAPGEPYLFGAPTVTGGIVFVGTDKGHLVVLGDPSIVPPDEWRCSNTHMPKLTPRDCTNAGYTLVPSLGKNPLADVAMPDGGSIAGLRSEPALAGGRVFVATLHGHVYMLATDPLSITLGAGELSTDHSTSGVVTVSRPPPMDTTVVLSSSDPSAISIPPSATVLAGNFTAMFTVTDHYAGPPKSVTITATYGGASKSASLSLVTPNVDPCRNCQTPAQCCVCNGGVWIGGRCE
jgi:outer membrane protein assembly factor BamB